LRLACARACRRLRLRLPGLRRGLGRAGTAPALPLSLSPPPPLLLFLQLMLLLLLLRQHRLRRLE
jgi:hypothetical protein